MTAVRSFRELTAWQRAMDLSVQVYSLTHAFPKHEVFGLTNQMRRASVSVCSNIAEGHSRISKAEFIQFLSIARGSNAELSTQLELARRLNFGNPGPLAECEALATEVAKMLNTLLSKLRTPKPNP